MRRQNRGEQKSDLGIEIGVKERSVPGLLVASRTAPSSGVERWVEIRVSKGGGASAGFIQGWRMAIPLS